MSYNIYQRVRDLVSENESRLTDKQVFTSSEYLSFLQRKAETCISGTCYSLRRHGFLTSEAEENRIINNLRISVSYDEDSESTASTTEQFGVTYININTASDMVLHQTTRANRHNAILGLLYHEIYHRLFTNFPILRVWIKSLERNVWWPEQPKSLTTVAGVNLTANMQDPEYRKLLCFIAKEIDNALEDGYIEREGRELFPGAANEYINTMNEAIIDNSPSLSEQLSKEGASVFGAVLQQVLMYALFGENNFGDCKDSEVLKYIWDTVDDIDAVKYERDSSLRKSGVNEIVVKLSPLFDEEIKKLQQRLQNQTNPNPNQNPQSGMNSASGSGSGSGTSSGGGSATGNNGNQNSSGSKGGQGGAISQDVAQALQSIISQAAQNAGTSSQSDSCTSSSLTDPKNVANDGANPQQQVQDTQPGGKTAPGATSGKGKTGAAENDLERIVQAIAQSAANNQAEKERTAELNQEYQSFDYGELHATPSLDIERASQVSEENRESYDKAADTLLPISRDLRRGIEQILKDAPRGERIRNLPFGRRIEVSSLIRDDGKVFSRKKLPGERRTMSVALLVDESGSTSGKLIQSSMAAAIVIEDFCRNLNIPHYICGYTSHYGSYDAKIYMYATPDEIDDSNRYRLTGMTSRAGTPTAAALCYVRGLLNKLHTDIKLLFVVSDGGAGDNYTPPNGKKDERPITKIISRASRDNMIIIACGIGSQRNSVQEEFGEKNFIDVSNLPELPEQIIRIIKQNYI